MQEWGVKPEIEAFDPGMIYNAQYYLKKGVLKAPLHFQFCMGCANGIPGSLKNLIFMKETMESLCPGSTWSCFGVGHCALEMLYGAVALGGHIRVGMEDNVMYAKGVLAESNVQFVERARRRHACPSTRLPCEEAALRHPIDHDQGEERQDDTPDDEESPPGPKHRLLAPLHVRVD